MEDDTIFFYCNKDHFIKGTNNANRKVCIIKITATL